MIILELGILYKFTEDTVYLSLISYVGNGKKDTLFEKLRKNAELYSDHFFMTDESKQYGVFDKLKEQYKYYNTMTSFHYHLSVP